MPYIGQPPVSGDTTKSFRLLDNLASFTLTFDATSSSVVDTTANTLTFANHRFVTAQRVTYTDGGGTAIGGLADGTAYFVIKVDQNTIQLASSASNANNSTAISLSAGAAGGSHTLNIAFDGTNTKFKVTYGNGTKAKISRAGQLLISINGVLQQAQESSTPTLGFGLDSDSTIVFSQAPVSTDVLFGQILADTITNFDTQDNTLDVFTGDGSTTGFTLSKKPASNNDILVTLDGVVQYPTTTSTSNAYSVAENTLTFTSAPANGVAIQVRHIGFAGATSSAVTGLYGRTGNVTLSSSDDDITVGNVTAGIITATSYGSISGTTASFSGNVSIGGTLTYEDVTNIDSVGLITARSGIVVTGGSVGIGTTNPQADLHIGNISGSKNIIMHAANNGDARVRFREGGSTTSGFNEYSIGMDGARNAMTIEGEGIGEIIAMNGDTGHIGIGTQFPGALLSLETNASNAAKIRLGFDGSRYYDIFRGSTTNGGLLNFYGSQSSFVGYVFDGVDGERMRIDTSGRLLLGTTTEGNAAADNLTVADSAACGISIRSGTSANGALYFSDGTSGDDEFRGYLIYEHNTNVLRFATDATERLRIDSSGRLLVGTTTEGAVSGDNLTIAASANCGMTIRSGTNNFGSIYFSDATSGAAEYDGYIAYSQPNRFMQFATGQAERMRIDSSGRLLLGTDTEGEANADDLTVSSSGSTGITIRSGTSHYGSIYFSDATSGAGEYDGYLQYNQSSQQLAIGTASATQMTITSAGKVGVGIAAPDEKLTVQSGSATDGRVQAHGFICRDNWGGASGLGNGMASPSQNVLMFTTNSTERARIHSDGGVQFKKYLEFRDGADATYAGYVGSGNHIITGASNTDFGIRSETNLLFAANGNNEVMRITTLSRIGIHQTASGAAESLQVSPTGGNGDQYCISTQLAATGGSFHFRMINGNGVVGSIKTSGSSTSFNTSSDYRLKENVVDITDGITRVKQLQPRRFNFIADNATTLDGFLAHEAQTVVPQAVSGEKDGEEMQSIDQSKLVPLLTAALQEEIAKREALEARIAALEGS